MKKLSMMSELCFKFCKYLLISLIPFIAAIVFLQVIMRYVFGSALFWAEELARYAMLWACCIGACLAIKTDEHIRLVFLLSKLDKKRQQSITVFFDLVTIVFFLLLTVYSVSLSIKEWGQVSAAMQIPMAFVYISVSVMSVVSVLFLSENLASNFLFSGKQKTPRNI